MDKPIKWQKQGPKQSVVLETKRSENWKRKARGQTKENLKKECRQG